MLPSSHLHVLMVLAGGEAHGYRIMQETEQMTHGAVTLRPGVLYSALGRLVDEGLITEAEERPASELDDQRRRYYRITSAGRDALGAEIGRLQAIVERGLKIEPSWGTT